MAGDQADDRAYPASGKVPQQGAYHFTDDRYSHSILLMVSPLPSGEGRG
jgi:hypothetical protein